MKKFRLTIEVFEDFKKGRVEVLEVEAENRGKALLKAYRQINSKYNDRDDIFTKTRKIEEIAEETCS